MQGCRVNRAAHHESARGFVNNAGLRHRCCGAATEPDPLANRESACARRWPRVRFFRFCHLGRYRLCGRLCRATLVSSLSTLVVSLGLGHVVRRCANEDGRRRKGNRAGGRKLAAVCSPSERILRGCARKRQKSEGAGREGRRK